MATSAAASGEMLTLVSQQKDAWDKAQIIGTLLSAILVALIGAYFTWLYNRQQVRVEERRREEDAEAAAARDAEEKRHQEEQRMLEEAKRLDEQRAREADLTLRRVEAVRFLFPQFKSVNERDRRAALLAVRALGDLEFAAELARIYGGPAGVSALVDFSSEVNEGSRADYAKELLNRLVRRLRYSVATVEFLRFGSGEFDVGIGSGFAISTNEIITAEHVVGHERQGLVGVAGHKYSSALITKSQQHGLALISAPDAPLVPIQLAEKAPKVDDQVVLVGWDHRRKDWVGHPGIVLDPESQDSSSDTLKVTSIEVGSIPGFSGAPALNSELHVVAVHRKKFIETNDEYTRGLARMVALSTLHSFTASYS